MSNENALAKCAPIGAIGKSGANVASHAEVESGGDHEDACTGPVAWAESTMLSSLKIATVRFVLNGPLGRLLVLVLSHAEMATKSGNVLAPMVMTVLATRSTRLLVMLVCVLCGLSGAYFPSAQLLVVPVQKNALEHARVVSSAMTVMELNMKVLSVAVGLVLSGPLGRPTRAVVPLAEAELKPEHVSVSTHLKTDSVAMVTMKKLTYVMNSYVLHGQSGQHTGHVQSHAALVTNLVHENVIMEMIATAQ